MYRLASKIGLESLKRLAFDAIRAGLCGQNILRELTSSLTAKYPEILAMQLDVLHSNFASTFVEDGLPSLAKQISRGELLQGEQIILGICQRVRRDYYLAPEEPVSCEVEARTYTTPPPRMGVKKGNTRTFK
ncbi:hypothetical protein SERLA73DRAFT_191348 [Serpula lacrymans var. lacrymans S7.3]|uniref:Uncharacterized protein n=2 Tax=Serpula lacrymans var. lacrymans TaxID=341189 RepID=F8QHC3_SERL3|nr:uncharacterized protein SERLADRAFT_477645 [Serpula lacrymans var. lacrymans S7.9]EGN92306.1 hypothetical protein SERLA73DRAFT_191348 [Serpula lacrymans var. lacrymans S7.3]EGO20254.1 hypothetical protein SERLADRAFT_477645 [Serpula lacrymans var. lacrymans S7.9]